MSTPPCDAPKIQITLLEARDSAPPRCVIGQEHFPIVPHLNLSPSKTDFQTLWVMLTDLPP